jgi:hypothetical protein
MIFKALMAPEYLTQMFHVFVKQTYQVRNNHKKLYIPKPKAIFKNKASPMEEQFHGTKF